MCQLTFADFNEKYKGLSKYIPILVLLNSLDNNPDGYGMNLNKESTIVRKTGKHAVEFLLSEGFDSLLKDVGSDDFCGIHHVRLASSMKKLENTDKTSHPFIEDRLVLAHNGTLNKNYSKYPVDLYVPKDTIDSENFLLTLEYFLGDGELTTEVINNALDCFWGTFALLIRDMKDENNLHIVRGEAKTLHLMKVKLGEDVIGIVINTKKDMLLMWSWIVDYIQDLDLEFEIIALEDNSHLLYKIGSLEDPVKMGKVNEQKTATSGVVTYSARRGTNHNVLSNTTQSQFQYSHQYFDSDTEYGVLSKDREYYKDTYTGLSGLLFTDFTLYEVQVISEVLFGKNIYLISENQMRILVSALYSLSDMSIEKINLWRSVLATASLTIPSIYNKHNLNFPYTFDSLYDIQQIKDGVK